MQIRPKDIGNFTSVKQGNAYKHAKALKNKVDSVAQRLISVDDNVEIDFTSNRPGVVTTDMRERSKYDGTLTTKGFLEYDLLSQKPKDMEVKENIFGVGIGFTVNDTRKFGFHETPDKEIYTMKRFGLRQELKIDKTSGMMDYSEFNLGLSGERFDFDY